MSSHEAVGRLVMALACATALELLGAWGARDKDAILLSVIFGLVTMTLFIWVVS